MAVADHGLNTGQGSNLLRRALGVTSGNQDAGARILPVYAAQVGPGGAVCLRSHRTSIDNDYLGAFSTRSRAQPVIPQLGANDLSVSPAGTASEVLDMVSCHIVQSSQSKDIAQTQVNSGRISRRRPFPPSAYSYRNLECS